MPGSLAGLAHDDFASLGGAMATNAYWSSSGSFP